MKNVLKQLTKGVLIPLGLTATGSATDTASQKKDLVSDCPSDLTPNIITLTISNEEMNDVMKIVKSLEDSGLLIKSVNETVKNQAK